MHDSSFVCMIVVLCGHYHVSDSFLDVPDSSKIQQSVQYQRDECISERYQIHQLIKCTLIYFRSWAEAICMTKPKICFCRYLLAHLNVRIIVVVVD